MVSSVSTVCPIKSPVLEDTAGLPLVERLRLLPDPRRRRGVRHPFVAVLPVAAPAVVAGARSYTAIGQWSADAPRHALRSAERTAERNARPEPAPVVRMEPPS
ncbi:transposase family protein [Streptomyces sp. NPDC015220]|uniref:transposase family protein n=1 Tax=Streptomyces sp. NPDC015220 TaxID=3364947 RepID=UPI0036F85A44